MRAYQHQLSDSFINSPWIRCFHAHINNYRPKTVTHQTTHTQIAVIGGGVSGICSAYFLALAGYDVAVIERHGNVAEEATLVNSGLMAPATVSPLVLPGIIRTAFASRFQFAPAIMTKSGLNPSRWAWHRKSRSQAAHEYAQNKEYLTRLNGYGQSLIHALQTQYKLEHENVEGVLRVFRRQDDLQRATSVDNILSGHDLHYQDMDDHQIKALEHTFISTTALAGARYHAQDEAGNCVLFVKQLKNITQAMGVQYHFAHNVKSIVRHDNNSITVDCGANAIQADAIVMCAGVNSSPLLKPLGIVLPLYPAESYTSVSTLKTTEYAPSISLVDESNRVSITRLGNRLRLTGLIGFLPHTKVPHKKAVHALNTIANDFFPNAVNYNNASIWSRTFAMTPNGLPLLGTTSYGNIFVNTGHGVNGWAAAVATGRLLTDHIMDRATDIDISGLFTHI